MTTSTGDTNHSQPPATTPRQQADRQLLETKTIDHLYYHVGTNPSNPQYHFNVQQLQKLLPTYSTATLHRIMSTEPVQASSLIKIISRYEPNDENLNDWISVEPLIRAGQKWPKEAIRGLPMYKHLAQLDGPRPERRVAQVNALIRVVFYFTEHDSHFTKLTADKGDDDKVRLRINDDKLSDLITTYENPEAIADIITTRNLIHPEDIFEVLNTMNETAYSIKDGVL